MGTETKNSNVVLTIAGEPVAKGRPRWAKWGMYNPKKTVNYETLIQEVFCITYPKFEPLKGQLSMTIVAEFTIPKNISKKKREEMIRHIIRPDKRPDIENVAKIVMDALTHFAYDDDKQIVQLMVFKFYAETPKVSVLIQKVTDHRGKNEI